MRRIMGAFAAIVVALYCVPAFAIQAGDLAAVNSPGATPAALAAMLMPGAVITDARFGGFDNAAGTFSNGLVDGIGIDSGLIFTTGDIANAVGPNLDGAITAANGLPGDVELDSLVAPLVTSDASVLEFDFTISDPTQTTRTFRFVFASDEYNESIDDPAGVGNDVFGLFIDEVNIALVPGTINDVTVKNLNGNETPTLFRNNDPEDALPTPFSTQYDGFSRVLTATVTVTPGVPHKFKLAIGDVSNVPDFVTDSAVFIAASNPVSFLDVPAGAFAFNQIMSIAGAGITAGCGGGNFCPNSPITRGQMAVFIETSLGVASAPLCAGNVFADVTAASVGAAMCGFIEDLAARGITGGCGGGNFCPNNPVTRGQMAVFIEAALGNPANPCTNQFADSTAALVGATFCGFIERLAADGITAGCGGGNFCPNDPVTRAQMAVFLVAAPPPLLP